MANLNVLGQQTAARALEQQHQLQRAAETSLTKAQLDLVDAIDGGLKPLTDPKVHAAIGQLERADPHRLFAEVHGVEFKGPSLGLEDDNNPRLRAIDAEVFTAMGIRAETEENGSRYFLVTLWNPKDEPNGVARQLGELGPSRHIRLNEQGDELRAFIKNNNVDALGSAFTALFNKMAEGSMPPTKWQP